MLDCSGSMSEDGKIQALNNAIKESIPHMQQEADRNPNAEVLVRAIKFSDGAQWHIADPTPIKDFKWIDLSAEGLTEMGKALSMVADQLKIPPMAERALPPVLLLISDGKPSDNFNAGLKALMDQPWGKRAVRLAIAIGNDVDYGILQKFIGNPEIKPLTADKPEKLVSYIKWASTRIIENAAAPSINPTEKTIDIPTASNETSKDEDTIY